MLLPSSITSRDWAIVIICALFALGTAAAGNAPPKKPLPSAQEKTLLLFPPQELGTESLSKRGEWVAALLTAVADFRLSLSSPFHVKSIDELAELGDRRIRNGGSDADAMRIGRKIDAEYILVWKFSFDKKQKKPTFRCEVRRVDGAGAAFVVDATVPRELLGYGIDSCLLEVTRRISGGSVSPEVAEFYKLQAISFQFLVTKKLGEVLYADLYGIAHRKGSFTDEYRKLFDKDTSALLGVYRCAKSAFAAQRYAEAVAGYRSIERIAPNKNRCRLPLARALLLKNEPMSALACINPVVCSAPVRDAYETLGDILLRMGKTTPALEAYYQEREKFGELPTVQEKIASVFLNGQKYAEAEAEYRRLEKVDSRHPTARHYQALCALCQGKTDKAVGIFTKAEAAGRTTPALYEQLGKRFAGARRDDKALAAYRQLLRDDPRNVAVWLEAARIEERNGRDSAAAEACVAAYECDHKYAKHLVKAGDLFSACRQPSKAADAYSTYLYHDKTNLHARMGLARIMSARKNHRKVIDLLEHFVHSPAASAELLWLLAESYCATGRYSDATPLLSSLVKLSPGDPRPVELSAIAYEKQGLFEKAAEMYEALLAVSSSGKLPDAAYHAGMLYEQNHQINRALARYEANIRSFPEDSRNYDRCGRLYVSLRDWNRARRYLESAVEFPQPAPDLKKLLGQTYAALDKKQDAIRLYRSYCLLVPDDVDALKSLGALFFDLRYYERAIIPLKKAAAGKSKDFDCRYMLGVAYVETADYEAGREALSRAHDLNPKHLHTIELLASCYRSLKRDGDLVAILKQWAAIEPKRTDIPIEQGMLYLANDKPGEAIAVLGEAVRLLPLDARPHKLLARCYDKLGDERMRLFHLKEANRFAPDDWDTHSELGFYYLSKNDPDRAERCLWKAVALNPNYARAYFEVGTILLDRNDISGAHATLERAVSIERGNPLYLAQFGRAASMMGDTVRADSAISAALGKNPGDPRVLVYSGFAYANRNKPDAAEKLYLEALSRDGGCILCQVALGDLYRRAAKYNQATAAYLKAWEKGGYREDVALRLGATLSQSEKYGEAKDFLETILVKNQANEQARYLLVEALCELGEVKKARETVTAFYGKNAVLAQLCIGRIHEKTKLWDAAAIAYSAADRLSPGHPLAFLGMARVLTARGLLDSATTLYAKARRFDSLDVRITMEMGALYEKRRKTDSALVCYYEVERNYPDHPRIGAEIARVRSQRGEHTAAIAALKRDIRLHPNEAHRDILLGKEYERAENYLAAIDAYEQALKKGSTNIDAFLYIGNIYYHKLVDEKKAKKYYSRYLKAGGKNSEALAFIKERD